MLPTSPVATSVQDQHIRGSSWSPRQSGSSSDCSAWASSWPSDCDAWTSWSSSDCDAWTSWSSSDCDAWTSWSSSDCSAWISWSSSAQGQWGIESDESHCDLPEGDEDYHPRSGDSPEAAMPISEENVFQVQNQETQSIAHLTNPIYWVQAYKQVDTLKPGSVVHIAVLEFFLSCESYQSRTSGNSTKRFYYLSQDAIGKLTGEPEEDQSLFRQLLAITTEKIEAAPIIFLVASGHRTYFLVMFDFCVEKVLILGRRGLDGPHFNKTHAEWESWKGPMLWQQIKNALIWPAYKGLDQGPVVYETDLISRDSHSGPGIVGFAQLLHGHKWKWEEFLASVPMPEVPCDHQAREQTFYTVLQRSYECFTLWKVASQRNNDWIQPPEDLLEEMKSQPARLQWVRNLSLTFQSQNSKCKRCSLWWQGFDDSSSEDIPLRGQRERAISPPTMRKRQPRLPDPLPLGTVAEDPPLAERSSNNSTFTNFDDYNSTPLARPNTPPVLNAWTFDCSGFLALPSWASTWKDQGYRLPPDFDKVSPKEHPTDYMSRLFPILDDIAEEPSTPSGDDGSLPSPMTPEVTHAGSTNSPSNRKREAISMSARSMLDEAGGPKTKESYDVFVRGKTRADDFIKLDLEKDNVLLTQEQIAISTDIDSILWVTRGRGFSSRGAINLHLKPHFAAQPPFLANPSIYATLLHPPESEAEFERPQLRRKSRFPLSSIPHMDFGHFGEATQQFNLYVFFPRMIHKHENNNRAITLMPQELQELWLSEAVFKALVSSMNHHPGISEYLPHSPEQLRWKTANRTRQPTLSVSPSALESLLDSIRDNVSENDLLSRFGSFFFVLDARGIKFLSKQHAPGENAFQTLQRLVPSLDWNHMLDRTKGELYLDLGVSFHPVNTSEPMVGLWRLSSLRSSYALMGHSKQKCEEYSHNTMQDYGGMKAQTSDITNHHTHIVKRISYNLCFEVVRQPGEAYMSKLDDMIRCNQKYVEGCKRWVKLLEEAEIYSYGVRDELRASAHVVTELLPAVMEKARRFLESDPIIWIPASTFFKFSSRRLVELHGLHCKFALTRPSNYGTLSALILHLMLSVMVTPTNVPCYVQSALKILHQQRAVERFGMFFVDDLDPNNMECIEVNLGVEESGHILRDHKAALASRFPPKKAQTRGIELLEPYRTADCPWGEAISWGTVQRLCKEHPVDFLHRFDFHQLDVGMGHLDLIEPLFTSFTRETWLGFHETFLPAGVRPDPNNLKDSMEVWTCQNIMARLGGKCLFLASTYGLEGAPTSKGADLSFKALRPLFFPIPDQRFKANAIWAGYSEQNGYIGKYWEALETCKNDPVSVDALHQGLDQIFEQLQCLPQSKVDSNLWHATHGSVCFLTNSQYYRIRSVSATTRKSHSGPQRPQVSLAELRKRLDPNNSAGKKLKRRLNKQRSTRNKNYRMPPRKRQQMDKALPAQARARLGRERLGLRSQVVRFNSKRSGSETDNSTSSEHGTMDGKSSEASINVTTESSLYSGARQ